MSRKKIIKILIELLKEEKSVYDGIYPFDSMIRDLKVYLNEVDNKLTLTEILSQCMEEYLNK